MTSLIVFLILTSAIFVLHFFKQKKTLLSHSYVEKSLLMQIDLQKQKSKDLSNKLKNDFSQKTNFKIDILKQQVNLLEIISNQTN